MRRRLLTAAVVLALGAFSVAVWPNVRLLLATFAVNQRSAPAEHALGFRVLADLEPGWVPLTRTDMHEAWKPLGLDGLNYFTYGAPEGPFARWATREDPAALRYQAWFGVYVVHPVPEQLRHSLTLADALLANDQKKWLETMGDPRPEVQTQHGVPAAQLTIDGRKVDLFEGEVATHSDWSRTPGLKLAPWIGRREQLPYERVVEPYHAIALKGFVASWYDEKRDAFFAVYGSGARFTYAYGGEVDTWPRLKDELLKMARSVRVERY